MNVNNICCEKGSCVTEFKTVVSSSVLLCKVRYVLLFCNQYCASMNSMHRLKINSELSGGICTDKHRLWCSSLLGCLCCSSLSVLTQDIPLVSLVTCLLSWHKGFPLGVGTYVSFEHYLLVYQYLFSGCVQRNYLFFILAILRSSKETRYACRCSTELQDALF
jgi:hypothetical protein